MTDGAAQAEYAEYKAELENAKARLNAAREAAAYKTELESALALKVDIEAVEVAQAEYKAAVEVVNMAKARLNAKMKAAERAKAATLGALARLYAVDPLKTEDLWGALLAGLNKLSEVLEPKVANAVKARRRAEMMAAMAAYKVELSERNTAGIEFCKAAAAKIKGSIKMIKAAGLVRMLPSSDWAAWADLLKKVGTELETIEAEMETMDGQMVALRLATVETLLADAGAKNDSGG